MLYNIVFLAAGLFSSATATVTLTITNTHVVCPCTEPGYIFGSMTAPSSAPTPSTAATGSASVIPPASSSTSTKTTSFSSAPTTCALLNAPCDDNAQIDQCCTDLGYYCSGGFCTDDDQVEGAPDTTTPSNPSTPTSAPSTPQSPSSSDPTCGGLLGATCDDSAEVNQCCTAQGIYCSGGSCTSDDAIEGGS